MGSTQQSIQFTSTEDGVSIAYWEIGAGKPVVVIQNWGLSHSELEWTVPSIRSFYEEMAKRYRLIRFDPRGIGLSGDPPGGWGTESSQGTQAGMTTHEMGLDIEAVTKALGLSSYALMAVSVQGPVGIQFAATHDAVTELILSQAMIDVGESALTPSLEIQNQIKAMRQGSPNDLTGFYKDPWETFAPEEDFTVLTRLVRASDSRIGRTPHQPQFGWNAEAHVASVSVPCLILCSRNLPTGPAEGFWRTPVSLLVGSPALRCSWSTALLFPTSQINKRFCKLSMFSCSQRSRPKSLPDSAPWFSPTSSNPPTT